jgi:hypothetical protein
MLESRVMSLKIKNFRHATAMSGAVPAAALEHEIATADVIVVGTVTSVSDSDVPLSPVSSQAEPAKDQLRVAELAVLRNLAGEHTANTVAVLFLVGKAPSRHWMELTQDQTVLLFLRSAGSAYVPVVPTGNPLQSLPEIAPPPAGSSRTQAVAHELEEIILTAGSKYAANLIVQATLARISMRCGLDYDLLDTPAFQDPIKRAAWVAIALAEGEIKALEEVTALFVHQAQPPVDTLWNLIVQKVSEVREPAARPQLATLLRNPKVELARAAAVALRQLHDHAAQPNLIDALDNADQEVRYQAVMGLAELEPTVEAGPSFELYRLDESRYIRLWKQWWESLGQSRINESNG